MNDPDYMLLKNSIYSSSKFIVRRIKLLSIYQLLWICSDEHTLFFLERLHKFNFSLQLSFLILTLFIFVRQIFSSLQICLLVEFSIFVGWGKCLFIEQELIFCSISANLVLWWNNWKFAKLHSDQPINWKCNINKSIARSAICAVLDNFSWQNFFYISMYLAFAHN